MARQKKEPETLESFTQKCMQRPMAKIIDVLDVRDGRSQRCLRLHKFPDGLTEGDDLLGTLRGFYVDGIIDLVILFLRHEVESLLS